MQATMARSVAPTVTTMPPMGPSASPPSSRPARCAGSRLHARPDSAAPGPRDARHSCHGDDEAADGEHDEHGQRLVGERHLSADRAARLAAGVHGLGIGRDAQRLPQQPHEGRSHDAQGGPDAGDQPRELARGRATAPPAGTRAPGSTNGTLV